MQKKRGQHYKERLHLGDDVFVYMIHAHVQDITVVADEQTKRKNTAETSDSKAGREHPVGGPAGGSLQRQPERSAK